MTFLPLLRHIFWLLWGLVSFFAARVPLVPGFVQVSLPLLAVILGELLQEFVSLPIVWQLLVIALPWLLRRTFFLLPSAHVLGAVVPWLRPLHLVH